MPEVLLWEMVYRFYMINLAKLKLSLQEATFKKLKIIVRAWISLRTSELSWSLLYISRGQG